MFTPARPTGLRALAHAQRIAWWMAATIFVCGGCGGSMESGTEPRDFSEFESFRNLKSPELGVCVAAGEIIDARIEQSGGEYALRLTVATMAGDEVGDALPARNLTAAEVDRVRATFSSIEVVNDFGYLSPLGPFQEPMSKPGVSVRWFCQAHMSAPTW